MARSVDLRRLLSTTAIVAAVVASVATLPAAAAQRPLLTAVTDPDTYGSPDAALAFDRTRAAGARLVRLTFNWADIAPEGKTKPTGFDASDPADPRYDFKEVDKEVRLAVAAGLKPIVAFQGAPDWAQDQSPHPTVVDGFKAGPYKPSPTEVGNFGRALARRYSGSFEGLPRVRYWLLWNEPNLIGFLSPQFEDGHAFSPFWYRQMLEPFTAAVHGVHADNVVVAGALAPFHYKGAWMAPLRFMRSLLCMSEGRNPLPVCPQQAPFDAFAVHPYTTGGPMHHAASPNDVSLGDLPEMHRLLEAAARYHRIRSDRPVGFWVTEFSWDTKPPDPNPFATPVRLQARWTAEALYQMWRSGVDVVTWFLLRDRPWPESMTQSGLYFRSGVSMPFDRPKPTLRAFRFPFVAFPTSKGMFVWGRTPSGSAGTVIVEQRRTRGWRKVATVRSDRFGIFSAVLGRPIVQPKNPPPSIVLDRYSAAVVTDFPNSYWRLDDRQGSTARDLTGRRTGSATGGVTFGVAGALLNDPNTALRLNGVDGRIDLGKMTSPRTVELWLKTKMRLAAVFSNRNVFHQFTAVGPFDGLDHVFDSFELFGGRKISDGRWHQLVYTYNGLTGSLYVDGRLDHSNTWSRLEPFSDGYLGYDPPIDKYFKGSIDEVALYDHPLTAAQIRRHFLASGRQLAPDPDFGALRARLVGSKLASLPFPLKPPPDKYVLPFGG